MSKTYNHEHKHEQGYFTVFGSMRVIVIKSASAAGAALRYMKKYNERPDAVLPGIMVH